MNKNDEKLLSTFEQHSDIPVVTLHDIRNKMLEIPTTNGHYVLLSDKPPPQGASITAEIYKLDGLYVWYNGTAKSIRGRVKSHLNCTPAGRYNINGAGALSVKASKLYLFKVQEGVKKSIKWADKENNLAYEKGINITESEWDDYSFSIMYSETLYFKGVLERLFRNKYGRPPLTTSEQR
jgi:hypothetical protein